MIKPVDEIPLTVRGERMSRRQMLQNDIQEAIDKGISKFEFEGDYNYKYLANYAREEADHILDKILRERWEKEPRQPYEENEFRVYPKFWERHIRERKYIIIHNVKREDRYHVFCEIIPSALDEMMDAHKKHLAEIDERKEQQTRERESRKMIARNLVGSGELYPGEFEGKERKGEQEG